MKYNQRENLEIRFLGSSEGFLGFDKLTLGVVFSVVIWRWTLAMRLGCGTHRIERRRLNF